MKVRIVNNGQPGFMTQITNAETGEHLDYLMVTEVRIVASKEVPHAVLTSVLPMIDVTAEAHIVQRCPHCGKSIRKEDKPPSGASPTKER